MQKSGPRKVVVVTLLCTISLCLFNEYYVYHFVIWKCNWPEVPDTVSSKEHQLRALVLADPHLLGEVEGHWLDKLRREWQIFQSYQTALHLHKPEVVFILGDLFDEGKWANSDQWDKYVKNAQRIFATPENIQLHVIVGNHDIGFHYDVTQRKLNRFLNTYRRKNVELLSIKGINFVIINTMGFDSDDCFMCKSTKQQLKETAQILNCPQKDFSNGEACNGSRLKSAPVLLQHFPMYRKSDESCNEIDSTPRRKLYEYVENHDALAKQPSQHIMNTLKPRLILSGHVHDACVYTHKNGITEVTVPSFSWRNRNNPSFLLMTFTSSTHRIEKCFLPKETNILLTYAITMATVFLTIFASHKARRVLNPLGFAAFLALNYALHRYA